MPSYLLLRDNKQTGPYSLDDLVALGLKAYDLIWVEGKSAAWRYPGEIAELKEFAPSVEEQPYDRFFKKPAEKKEELPVKQITRQVHPSQKKMEPKQEPVIKKQVYVSMPENVTAGQQDYSKQYQSYLPKETQPVKKESYSPISINEAEETRLETKYSQSLDEIKEMYVNTLVQRKTRNRRKELAKKYAAPVLAAVVLLVAGVVIGYMLTSNKTVLQASQLKSGVQPSAKVQGPLPANGETIFSENDLSTILPQDNQAKPEEKKLLTEKQSVKKQDKQVLMIDTKPQNAEVKKNESNSVSFAKTMETPVEKKSSEIDPVTGERKKTIRNDEGDEEKGEKKESVSNNAKFKFLDDDADKNLAKKVTVSSNNYIRGTFGGIKDLQLTLNNDSRFLLDEVQVELQILKASQQPLKTDIITFRNVGPNQSMTVRVPDSQRGIRVEYRIKNIESKEFQKATAGL